MTVSDVYDGLEPDICPGCDMLPCMCKHKCKVCGEFMCANESHWPPQPNEDEIADRALEDRYEAHNQYQRQFDPPW
jgi:hypothetical protein